jgi:hypothetical protein
MFKVTASQRKSLIASHRKLMFKRDASSNLRWLAFLSFERGFIARGYFAGTKTTSVGNNIFYNKELRQN